MANVFTAGEKQTLHAVSFYAAAFGTKYELFVDDVSGGASSASEALLAAGVAGTLEKPGYHTITLPRARRGWVKECVFRVRVKLTTPGYEYPLPVELPLEEYSDNATASPGESFYSADGASMDRSYGRPRRSEFLHQGLRDGRDERRRREQRLLRRLRVAVALRAAAAFSAAPQEVGGDVRCCSKRRCGSPEFRGPASSFCV